MVKEEEKNAWTSFPRVRSERCGKQGMGTLPEFSNFVQEELKNIFVKIERLQGDGDVGTLQKVVFVPGALPGGITTLIEKITKVVREKRIKEKEVVEGDYLDLGFTSYRLRFEILEKDKDSCIIKSTIEYHLKREAAANEYTLSS